MNKAIAHLAQNKGIKVVAEAWDTGGYGVGQFPAGWSEWNGFYRDNLRKYAKGDNSQVGNYGASVTGTWTGFQTFTPQTETTTFIDNNPSANTFYRILSP